MDEHEFFDSMVECKEQLVILGDLIDLFLKGKNLKHLKTFRVSSVRLAHSMKELRALSLDYEKEQKERLK